MRRLACAYAVVIACISLSSCGGVPSSRPPGSGSSLTALGQSRGVSRIRPNADAIVNGGFETGSLGPWKAVGSLPGAGRVVSGVAHSGTHSALMGTAQPPAINGLHGISQAVTVPAGGVLSFWYQGATNDTPQYASQVAELTNSSGAVVFTCWKGLVKSTTWVQKSCDVSAYGGKLLNVVFGVNDNGYAQTFVDLYVDDVSLAGGGPTPTPSPSGQPTPTPVPTPTGHPTPTPVPTPTPGGNCQPVNKSRYTLVTADQVYNGKVTAAYVGIKGTIVLNEAGDYTDRHIQFKTAAWRGGFNNSLASESVQEYRWSFLPQANQNVIAYGVLRYDVYHSWYELHPAYEYDLNGGGGGHAACTPPDPTAYTPQTVTQIATGQFPFPRTAVNGKVVKINPTVNGVQSFVITDGTSQLLVENPPENHFTLPAVGKTVKVLGIPRQMQVATGTWEINPAFVTSAHLANPPNLRPPED